MLLLVEGSTGGERKEFLGGEGQKEFAPEEMEHIQVCLFSVMRAQAMFHQVKGSGTLLLFFVHHVSEMGGKFNSWPYLTSHWGS